MKVCKSQMQPWVLNVQTQIIITIPSWTESKIMFYLRMIIIIVLSRNLVAYDLALIVQGSHYT